MDAEPEKIARLRQQARQLRELSAFEKDPKAAREMIALANDLESKVAAAEDAKVWNANNRQRHPHPASRTAR
jgi:hypothetical protein